MTINLNEIPDVQMRPLEGTNTQDLYAHIDNFLTQTAGRVIGEWIEQIKSGFGSLISQWAPLSEMTVEDKIRDGAVNPMAPLYNTGALIDRMKSWKIETVKTENADGSVDIVASVDMGAIEKQTGQGSLIDSDMIFGRDAVGTSDKTSIPARPMLITDDQLSDVKMEYNTWFTGMQNQGVIPQYTIEDATHTPHEIDPSDYDLYWSNRPKWS